MIKNYLTIDIGGTDIKYGIINDNYELITTESTPTKAEEGGLSIINQIIDFYNFYKESYQIEGISISSAGIIDPVTTTVLNATSSIKNFVGLNFKEEINKYIDIDVSVENDVNSVALCEAILGSGKNFNNVAGVTIGTGIGGAIIKDKKLYHGSGFNAGEWGRTIIDYKNFIKFEDLASTRSLVNFAKEVNVSITNGVDVFKLYDKNDSDIIPIVNNFYYNLSIGIINIIYSYSPEVIILGGGITARGQLFLDELLASINKLIDPYFLTKTKIKLAEFRNNAGMVGALINFKSK